PPIPERNRIPLTSTPPGPVAFPERAVTRREWQNYHREPGNPFGRMILLAHCASWYILLQCGTRLRRVRAALLGRFLPRLGPLATASGPFSFASSGVHASARHPPRA